MSGFDPCSNTNDIKLPSAAPDPVVLPTKGTRSTYELKDMDEDQICQLLAHCKLPSVQDTVKEQGLSGYVLDTTVDSADVLVEVGMKLLPARSFFKLINEWKTVGLPPDFTPTVASIPEAPVHVSKPAGNPDLPKHESKPAATPDPQKRDPMPAGNSPKSDPAPASVVEKAEPPKTTGVFSFLKQNVFASESRTTPGAVKTSDVGSEWENFVTIAEKIRSLIQERKFPAVTTELVRSLDPIVRRVSQLMLKSFPPTTVLFYGLPISVTAAARNEGAGKKWDNDYDHWVITSTERLFMAWRQDSAYFQVFYDNTKTDGLLTTLTAGRELLAGK